MIEHPTLGDVAAAAGVSHAIAARSLDRRGGVTLEVRDRVVATADALGYRRDRSARRLASGGSSVLALILGSDGLERRPWMVSLLQAFVRAADRQGHGLVTVVDSSSPSDAIRHLISDGLVEGVVIREEAVETPWVAELVGAGVPAVLIGHHSRWPHVPTVSSENLESSAALVGAMLDAGAERVAMIAGQRELVDVDRRREGYRAAHERRKRPVDRSLTFRGNLSAGSGYRLADDVLAAGVDGVFCANDDMALGLLHRLHELGVSVPAHVMVAGFDGTVANSFMPLRFLGPDAVLATARTDFDRMADVAVESLRLLAAGVDVPTERLAEPVVTLGTTIRPPLATRPLRRVDPAGRA